MLKMIMETAWAKVYLLRIRLAMIKLFMAKTISGWMMKTLR